MRSAGLAARPCGTTCSASAAWPRQRSIMPRWKSFVASLRAQAERELRVAQRLGAAAVPLERPREGVIAVDPRPRLLADPRAPRASGRSMPWSASKSAYSTSVRMPLARWSRSMAATARTGAAARALPWRPRKSPSAPTYCGSGTVVAARRSSRTARLRSPSAAAACASASRAGHTQAGARGRSGTPSRPRVAATEKRSLPSCDCDQAAASEPGTGLRREPIAARAPAMSPRSSRAYEMRAYAATFGLSRAIVSKARRPRRNGRARGARRRSRRSRAPLTARACAPAAPGQARGRIDGA